MVHQNDPGQPLQFVIFPVPYDKPDSECDYATSPADGHTAGWNQAQLIYQAARSAGLPVLGGMWWLDIEATSCPAQNPPDRNWNPAKWQINLAVIQGAVDYLHSQGVTVGIYTDPGDWDSITNCNTTQFAGIPAWNADPYDNGANPYVTVYNNGGQDIYDLASVLSWARSACGLRGYTGGPLQAVQYMWGDVSKFDYATNQPPAILGRDFDYECQGGTGGGPGALTDLFVYNKSTGASWVEFADGSGGWRGVKGPQFSAGWQFYPGHFGSGGLTDFFLYNPSNGAWWVEFPDGSGGWRGVKGPQFSPGWDVSTGNFNGDGLTDLFVYNPSSGASWVEFANGSGGWRGVKGPLFSPGWTVYTGNFNGDGLTDLFVYNKSSGASWVELANGSGGWTGVKGPQFSAGWDFYPGSLGGDGLTDFFLYNPSTGASWVEFASGAGGWRGGEGSAVLSRLDGLHRPARLVTFRTTATILGAHPGGSMRKARAAVALMSAASELALPPDAATLIASRGRVAQPAGRRCPLSPPLVSPLRKR